MQVRFDLPVGAPMTFKIGEEVFSYPNTDEYAVIGNLPAGISEEVRRTKNGRYIYLTVIADESEMTNAYGTHHGFYVARFVNEDEAKKIRKSWDVLRPQNLELD